MIIRFAPIVGLGFVSAGIAFPGAHFEPQHNGSDVDAMFQKNCASCHVRPDPQFKTDKAWIERIAGTT
ncbi:MAG: hypothetical protein IH999_06950 [Proteobacteria bacterium]|nr:hypothetical protein [Pseudomonadota bacterium]